MKNFPRYAKLASGSTRWRLSDLLQFEADRDGTEPPAIPPEAERYLSAEQVAQRYGVSRTSIWRWTRESAEVAA